MAHTPNSAADYAHVLRTLLPRGRVWTREDDGTQAGVLDALGVTAQTTDNAAVNLIVAAFPATATDLLPEWEASLGLPDPCVGEAGSTQQRRQQVVARLTNSGGASAQYFIDLAASLGYTITVENCAPFRCGQSTCGDPLGNQDWSHTWVINAPVNTVTYFQTGLSTAGDPLASWGNDVLECEMNALKPAHTILQFHYS
ncbi:YmfQ family protein [Paraburkholderia sp. HD33-4]|uniref:YmfQ family protein n=1 Tax=Paraburkholderia sp. HD33-4 TaxID=2883242 RepID=UPI001F3A3EBD|nr:putative phage tail protein [Paraburkholderia sp. HD33-4]